MVLRSLRGEEAAFEELVRRYERAAFSVALSVTGRREDAEDAAQESFMVALERLEECRNPERFGGWFVTIVRNRARNLVRRESIRSADPLPPGARSDGSLPDRFTELAELRQRIQDALATLPEVQREIVLLHDLEGWKHREIAERLELPAGTVRSHLHFARKALHAALRGPEEEEEDTRRKVP